MLAGEGWHPGVIGIVASRIAERHHRPCVMLALDGADGTGSGRSIPAFDLLGGLDACAAPPAPPRRPPRGGRAARSPATTSAAFRAAFTAHAAAVLTPEDLVPRERVDAVVAGDELGMGLAEELERLAPFGIGNPEVSLLVPAARLADPRPMGEGKHLRFTVEAGGVRARAVAFGMPRLPASAPPTSGSGSAGRTGDASGPLDATFGLELNEWNGAVEPRLVLRRAQPPEPGPIALVGEPEDEVAAALAELDAPLGRRGRRRPSGGRRAAVARPPRRRRGRRHRRARRLGRAGARRLRRRPRPPAPPRGSPRRLRALLVGRARARPVADRGLRPRRRARPAAAARRAAATAAALGGAHGAMVHLAWGDGEVRFALAVLEATGALRAPAGALYRALRGGADLSAALAATGPPAVAGRALRVLCELGLVIVDARAARRRCRPRRARTSSARRRSGRRRRASRPVAGGDRRPGGDRARGRSRLRGTRRRAPGRARHRGGLIRTCCRVRTPGWRGYP